VGGVRVGGATGEWARSRYLVGIAGGRVIGRGREGGLVGGEGEWGLMGEVDQGGVRVEGIGCGVGG